MGSASRKNPSSGRKELCSSGSSTAARLSGSENLPSATVMNLSNVGDASNSVRKSISPQRNRRRFEGETPVTKYRPWSPSVPDHSTDVLASDFVSGRKHLYAVVVIQDGVGGDRFHSWTVPASVPHYIARVRPPRAVYSSASLQLTCSTAQIKFTNMVVLEI